MIHFYDRETMVYTAYWRKKRKYEISILDGPKRFYCCA